MDTRFLIKALWDQLNKRRKYQLKLLLLVMMISSFSEVIAVSALLPFLATLSNPQKVMSMAIVKNYVIPFFKFDSSKELIILLTLVFISANLFSSFLRIVNIWFSGRLSASIGTDFGTKLFSNLLNQDYIIHIQRNSADVLAIATTQVNQTILAVYRILEMIAASLIVLSLLISLAIIDFQSTLIVFSILIVVYFVIAAITKNKLSNNSKIYAKHISYQVKIIQEGLGSIRDILLGAQQTQYVNTYRFFDNRMRLTQSQNRVMGAFPKYLLEGIGLSTVALIGAFSLNNENSLEIISKLGIIALGSQKILPATQQAYIAWTGIKGAQKSVENVLKLLKKIPINSRSLKINSIPFNDFILLKNISFSYSENKDYVLKNINIKITKGDIVGIKGSTGCGKSTLIDIISGLLKPTDGSLIVDNININKSKNNKLNQGWRNLISYVPQFIYLSDKSIADNIALSDDRKQIDEELLKEVLKIAQLNEFMLSLKDGPNTIVGERGIRLSGGQKQRIGIARALYKRLPILILDEATSALDIKTEDNLMREIYSLKPRPTIIIVAHRLSTLYACNKIIDLS